jgi:anti-anti-sigma factor
MEAEFKRVDGFVVVELKGRLDPEGTESFRNACLGQWLNEKVVFDLKHLSFVGSLGLQTFVDTLDHMSQKSVSGMRLCGVGTEFRRLFEATGVSVGGIFNTRDEAFISFRSVPSAAAGLQP